MDPRSSNQQILVSSSSLNIPRRDTAVKKSYTMTSMLTTSPLPSTKEAELANNRIRELREKLTRERERQQERLGKSPSHSQSSSPPVTSLAPRISPPRSPVLPSSVVSPQLSPGSNLSSAVTESQYTMQGLLRKVADLESRLSVANRVAEFLKTDAKAQQEREHHEASLSGYCNNDPADGLQVELKELQRQLREKERLVRLRESDCRSQGERVKLLEADLAQMKNKLQQQSSSSSQEHTQLLQSVQELETRFAESKNAAAVLEGQVAKAEQDKATHLQRAQDLERQLGQVQSQLQQNKQEAQALDQRIEDLQRQLQESQAQVAQVQQQASQANQQQGEAAGLAQELEALKQELKEKDGKIQFGFERYSAQATKIEELTAEMATMEDHLNKSYNETLDQMIKQIADLEAKLQASQQEFADLQEQSSQVSNDRENSDAQVAELKSQVTDLKTQLESAQTALAAEKETTAEQAAKIKELNQEMAEMEDHLNQSYSESLDLMTKQIAELKERLTEADKQAKVLEQASKDASQETTAAKGQTQKLQAHLTTLQAELDAGKQELQASNEKCTAQAKKIQKLQSKVEKLQEQLQNGGETEGVASDAGSRGDVSSGGQSYDELTEQIASLEQRLADSNKVLKFLQSTASQAQEDSKVHQEKAEELQEQLVSLQKQLEEKEAELKASNEELNAQKALAENTKMEVAELQAKLVEVDKETTAELSEEAQHQHEEEKAQLRAEIGTLQNKLVEQETKLELLNKTSNDEVLKNLEDLSKQIGDLEGKLREVNKLDEHAEEIVTRALKVSGDGERQQTRVFLLAAIMILSTVSVMFGVYSIFQRPVAPALEEPVVAKAPEVEKEPASIKIDVDVDPIPNIEELTVNKTAEPAFAGFVDPNLGTCLLWEHEEEEKTKLLPDMMASMTFNSRVDRQARERQGDRTDYTVVIGNAIKKTSREVNEHVQGIATATGKAVKNASDKAVKEVSGAFQQANTPGHYKAPEIPRTWDILAAVREATAQSLYTPPADNDREGQCQCF